MQVTWYYAGVPAVPRTNIPPSQDQDTHGFPRKEQTAQDMMYHFFTTGEVVVCYACSHVAYDSSSHVVVMCLL
jgi:hypothetical protein